MKPQSENYKTFSKTKWSNLMMKEIKWKHKRI